MDCREVKRLITLYVDGELDASENRDMVEHISMCESCYFAVRSERFVKRLLKKSLNYEEPPLGLVSRINDMYEEKKSIFPVLFRFAPALLLVFFLALAFYHKMNQQRLDNKIFRTITNPPLSASVSDVNKFFSIFKNSTDRLFINKNSSPNIKFVGLRYNRFEDRDAAHIYYNHKGRNISVFAISGAINDKIFFTSLKPYKGNSFITSRDGKNLLLSSDKDITYAVAGDADENELYEILSSLR